MRRFVIALVCVAAAGSSAGAQQRPAAAAAAPLPVTRVVLYKAGVGYFEHVGEVSGNGEVTITFTSGQLDDALKSLAAVDLGDGRVTGIRYNSVAPIAERLRTLRLPLDQTTSLHDLLVALRGARVTVRSGAGAGVAGRLVSLDRRTRIRDGDPEEYALVVVAADGGEIRSFELTPSLSIALGEVDLRRELDEYLRTIASSRERDVRRLTVSTQGSGRRRLLVSYISEVPVWKVNYRLLLNAAENARPVLQAWAIVDNTAGEDWRGVELSLVAGAPQSFVQPISQPIYTRRPVVPVSTTALLTPQTHQATLRQGTTGVRGRVLDVHGAALPGTTVTLLTPEGTTVRTATTGSDGTFLFSPLEEGTYRLRAALSGFRTFSALVVVSRGAETVQDVRLGVEGLTESVAVSADAASPAQRRAGVVGGAGGGVVGGVVGGLPEAPPPPAASGRAALAGTAAGIAAEAEAQPAGDAFEYRIKQPITVLRNESALVPIARAEIEADKVTLWSARSARPVRAVWVTNSSGLTLDAGTFSVIEDGAFAGEGLLEVIKPGERRLLSYAADAGVRVESKTEQEAMRIFRARARDGLLLVQRERRERRTYTVRNDNDAARVVVLEHPTRDGWRLTSSVEAAEQAAGVTRFRVPVEAHKSAIVTVTETRPEERGIAVTDVTRDFLGILIDGGLAAEDVQRALEPVLAKRAEAEAARREMQKREQEIAAIERDQQRLRENLKALSDSRADRDLIGRYTRQMGTQEDRLETLRREIARLQEQIVTLEQEAQRLLDAVTIETPSAR